ncbi:hypothetical protein MML48_1g02480 [Holotrichia oblita]|uniref:Uncharacterized protein n=1 Tax=Holotrichia oblita TaxID=644536 RepID=A0ACB9TV21_HOLOL|nr:hypothetical protein MML48_1g02480 [Holotrichia oblita]
MLPNGETSPQINKARVNFPPETLERRHSRSTIRRRRTRSMSAWSDISGLSFQMDESLLNKLHEAIDANRTANIIAGFDKSGILPLNADRVLRMLPVEDPANETQEDDINNSFIHILKYMRYDENQSKQRQKKMNVPAGKSVVIDDFESSDESSQHFSTHD